MGSDGQQTTKRVGSEIDSNTASSPQTPEVEAGAGWSRRGFLRTAAGVAGAGALGGTTTLLTPRAARAAEIGPLTGVGRETEAANIRNAATNFQAGQPIPSLPCNGDEALYANRIGQFTKTLPHNNLGEVDPAAYNAFLNALSTGDAADFDAIPAGGGGKLANPRAAYAFSLGGADAHKINMPAVHAFNSARQSAEAGEVYWMAATRDVDYDRFGSSGLINAAAADMSNFSDFTGPKIGGQVTPGTLFRGLTPGDLNGPFISQFLFLDIPYGNRTNRQVARNPRRGVNRNFMCDVASWLAVQRGQLPASTAVPLENRERYIQRGRDLGEYVHRDYTYQAYLNAALICLGFGGAAFDPNPYSVAAREGAFVTFGGAAVLDLVARAGVASLRAAWFHKWLIHRKLRPEAFGGRLHFHMTGAANYPIDAEILNSPVLNLVFGVKGNYLLPQAFPEGSPTHPSYPAGHATIAGACVTVLKAIFDEDFVIPDPQVPRNNGRTLKNYNGGPLTLGGELNKLASNIALGRNIAGVHWRADGDDGLVAGEDTAIALLQDYLRTLVEPFAGYSLTKFDGTTVMITADNVVTI